MQLISLKELSTKNRNLACAKKLSTSNSNHVS